MDAQAIFAIVLLIATLVVMSSQKMRADLVAVIVMLLIILSGILTPEEAFSAFGQPVIIVVACIYIIGAALYETGVATIIANQILRFSSKGEVILLLVIMLLAALMTSVLGGLLVVALLMPAALRVARKTKLAPSRLLLPLATVATVGNQLTLIGTPGNLVVSNLLVAGGYQPLDLLTLTPYALVSVAIVVVWYLLPGRRLLKRELPTAPEGPSLDEVQHDYKLDRLLYRLRVRAGSSLVDTTPETNDLSTKFGLNLIAIRNSNGKLEPVNPNRFLAKDDVLIVTGDSGQVLQATNFHNLEAKGAAHLNEFSRLEQQTLRLAEVIVPIRSALINKTLAQVDFRDQYGLNVLAVQHQGKAMRKNLPDLILSPGDTLLVQGDIKRIKQVGRDFNLAFVTDLGPQPGDIITSKARLTLVILALMLAAIMTGLLSLAVAGLAAAITLILTGCIGLNRAYRSIDAKIIVLIGAMLPLAAALEKTGAAGWIADGILAVGQDVGSVGSLLILYLLAGLITQVISNSVVAALMMPIAINLAVAQGLNPMPFAIAIAFASNGAFVTPFTDGDNLLVREPGQYGLRDYVINGLPIFVVQTVAVIGMLVFIWW